MSLDKPVAPATGAPTKLGRYTLVKELAGSGVGSTWIARGEDRGEAAPKLVSILRLHRHVTKKVELAETILNAARHAQKLKHDNVATVIETGVADGEVFVVSEHVEGETLAGLVAAAGPEGLTPDVVLRIGLDVLEALSAAHGLAPEPLVHGELNPWNVFVDTNGITKVGAFGIARALSRIGTHSIKGPDRLAYAAPERVKHMATAATTSAAAAPPLDPRSDVFSAGVILWELVTKQRLFASKMEAAVIQKVLTAPIPSVRDAAPADSIAPEVEQAIAKALDRDPSRRFSNVGDFVFALEEAGPDKIALAEKVAAALSRACGKAIAQRKSEIEAALASGGTAMSRAPAAPRPRAPTLLGISAGVAQPPATGVAEGVNVPAPADAKVPPAGAVTAPPPTTSAAEVRPALPTPAPDGEEIDIAIEEVESVRASKIISVEDPAAAKAPAPPPKENDSPEPTPAAPAGAPKRPRVATLLGFVPPSEVAIEKAKAEAARARDAKGAKPPPPPPAKTEAVKEGTETTAAKAEPPGRLVSAAGAPPVFGAKPPPPPAKRPPIRPPDKAEEEVAAAPEKVAAKAEAKVDTKAEAKAEAKVEAKADTNAEAKPASPKPPPVRPAGPPPTKTTDGKSANTPTSDSRPRGKAGEAVDKLRPGVTLGRYEILMQVARGGMASVWAARLQGTRGFQKIVAIKTMLPDVSDDPEFETMFLDEARVAAKIRHPNVAEIMDLGEENDVLYLVMEWVDGETTGTIQKAAKAHGGIPLPIVLRIASQACAGLHAAHELRDDAGNLVDLVHRDISPANVLVSTQGFVKLVDFGIAKSKGRLHVTRAGDVIKGKTPYLSPEQLGGLPVDRRSDIFSLGALLYVLTTGLHPFRGETDVKTVENIALKAAVPLRELVPSVHPDFEKIVLKALEKDPAKRFATAAEMQRALDQVASAIGSPVTEEDVAAFVKKVVGDLSEKRSAELRAAIAAADAAPDATAKPAAAKDDAPHEISGEGEAVEAAPGPASEEAPSDGGPVDATAPEPESDATEASASETTADSEEAGQAVEEAARAAPDRRRRLASMVVLGAVAGCAILGLIALTRGGSSSSGPRSTAETAAPVRTGSPVVTQVATGAPPAPSQTATQAPAATAEPVAQPPEPPPPEPPEKPAAEATAAPKGEPAEPKPAPKAAAPKPPPAKPAPAKPPSKPAAPKPPAPKKYNPKGI